MGFHGAITQGLLHVILASLSFHSSCIHGSPQSSDHSLCPRGWYQYDRFCVARGHGSSDRAVALYCDGFGGIGIKGICIIKIHTNTPTSTLEREDSAVNFSQGFQVSERSILQSAPDENQLYSALVEGGRRAASGYQDASPKDDSAPSDLDGGVLSNQIGGSDGFCPKGWAHYGSVCVYKPWSVAERCHLMNSVEFHGLCVKHADIQAVSSTEAAGENSREKRICCCASFKAKGNKYGC
jgi:hypothetical protein